MFFKSWRDEVISMLLVSRGSLSDIRQSLFNQQMEIKKMSAQFDALTAAVATLNTNVQAATAEIAKLNTEKEDPAAVQALTDQVNAASAALVAAVPPAV